jgi:hypothetical protein
LCQSVIIILIGVKYHQGILLHIRERKMAEKAEVKPEVKTEPKTGDGAMDPKSKGILIGAGLVLGALLLSNTTFNFHQPYPVNPPSFTTQPNTGRPPLHELIRNYSKGSYYQVPLRDGNSVTVRSCLPSGSGDCWSCSNGSWRSRFCHAPNGQIIAASISHP